MKRRAGSNFGNYILDNGTAAVPLPKRQASAEYRGVVLPVGMTPACLDEIAGLLNRHQLADSEDTDAEGAVRIFEAVRARLR